MILDETNVDAFLFDLDGTLTTTKPTYIQNVVHRTLQQLKSNGATAELVSKFWFERNRNETIKSGFGVDPEKFWPIFREIDVPEKRRESIILYDDIDFVRKLRPQNKKVGSVTNAPENIASINLHMIGLSYFDAIVTGEAGVPSKPDPAGILLCLEKLRVPPERAAFIGNSDEDILAAKAAGVYDILIDRGEHVYPDVFPTKRITSLHQLDYLVGKK